MNFIKPDLTPLFFGMPFIGEYMRIEYDKQSTREAIFSLVYKWMDESEASTNSIRKQCYRWGAVALYERLTGISWNSRVFIID